MKTDGTRWGRNPLRRIFVLLPGSGRLLQIIWPFLVIVLVLLLLASESMSILSAARAYSEGESLWSKGQKRAMFHLMRYSETHAEDDYQKYRDSISVPLGDEKARVELEKPDPDYSVVWQGFIAGRNHPDDIPGLIMLFRRFRRLDFMAAVIDLWAEGDQHIAELTRIADQLHTRISSGQTSMGSVLPFRDRILDIDTRLTPLTDKFTSTLGEATRKTRFILLLANLAVAGTLVPVGIYLSYLMVRRREEAERALNTEKERAQVTLASIADGVITTDTDGLVEYLNPVAELLTGWTAASARGWPLQEIVNTIDETTRKITHNPVEMVLREERTIEVPATILLVRNDNSETPIVQSAAPIRARTGEIIGVVLILHDVSRERQYVAKLSYQASHDSLTGLINRTEFERRLALALKSSAELSRNHAVMYLDLDQFKVVNDTCGHAAGDQLIRQVSAVLLKRLREGDTLARLGGDEFGVLLENCPPDHALRIADQLRQTVTDFHFVWETRSFGVAVSIGLVNVKDGPLTLADVMSAADAACYMAKEKGRNRVQLYHAEDSELSVRQGEMEWISRLQKALKEDRFVLYTQDIKGLDARRNHGTHCEILVRLLDERGELVPPMAFIPAAERYNMMPGIDRWVIRTAFATISREQAEGGAVFEICAINLSGGSIGDEGILGYVREQFARFPAVRPQSICFEITETAAIARLDKATHFINEMKSLGCRFSLDDFGAGMSSFAYLKHLPVDFLKIDGGFVKNMADDPIDRAMVEAINSVGHITGKQTIAEFVDGERVIKLLREIGVDFAQGYGVAKPRPFGPRLQVAAATG